MCYLDPEEGVSVYIKGWVDCFASAKPKDVDGEMG